MKLFSEVSPMPTSSTYTLQPINTYVTDFHYTDKFCIIFIENGSGSGKINDSAFTFMGPNIICLNRNEQLTFSKTNNIKGYVLTFAPSTVRDYFTFDNVKDFDHSFTAEDIRIALNLSVFYQRFSYYIGQVPASEPMMKQIYKLLDRFNRCNESVDSASNIIIDLLGSIKRLVQTSMSVSNVIITETTFEVKDVLIYLHDNCKQKITIPKLSKQFHVNRTTLSDRFFEATGETIITYLNKYRINLAAIMLRESNLSISNIAEEVGFNDTAYFAKLFKKYMFHTPSGYRQHYVSLCQVHKVSNEDEATH